ncbi:MAG: glycosyl transferase family 1 [Sphingobium sp. 66-54]|nr:MAG: glycosyl transferase family 1 [Sphingobium sp. 66-54]
MFFRTLDVSLSHIAVLGNALPRRCGLATYTSHSVAALREAFPGLKVDHYAMDDGQSIAYGPDVAMTIPADDVSAYVRAAAAIRRSGAQLLWVHHEFGIFGGPAGRHLLVLLEHLDLPVVTTLHTLLSHPDPDQARVMQGLLAASDRLIVMARKGARMLADQYQVDPRIVRMIPHGAPDRPLRESGRLKEKLGLGDGPIVLTFGLLSPGKGIETAIQALPPVVAKQPDLRYLVVGATHPALVRDQGETYRESLIALAARLGMGEHVRFVDRFLEDEELLDYLQAADIYLTPYPGEEQITSGTLAYALALGRPVVSTPYVHAREALANGVGTLVPFGDAAAMAGALIELLADPARLAEQARRIWRAARPTIWARNARAVMDVMNDAKASRPVALPEQRRTGEPFLLRLDGIAAMTDGVGIIQHSVHGVPDRHHGYCIDDNARALKLLCETRAGDPAARLHLIRIYAAFLQHAWNEETGRFRNFMGFDRRWLEEAGSEDSNGRTLWALGRVMRAAPHDFLRRWATGLFERALPLAEQLHSPRAMAFAMLGVAAAVEADPGHEQGRLLLRRSTETFSRLLNQAQRPDWSWFEIVLAYDNARLPQAMIEAGRVLDDKAVVATGLATLRWLMEQQKAPAGHFRPVGTESFGKPFAPPATFDQQPLEAAATIDACLSAFRVDGDAGWVEAAERAFTWFEGDNDLGLPLASEDGAFCYDGLTPQGVNLNLGAESILAMQMARQAMAELNRAQDGTPQLSAVQ